MSSMTEHEFPLMIQLEIEDERFLTRTHGRTATYDDGCRGPFCKKAHRDKQREKYRARQIAAGKPVRPYPPRNGGLIDTLIQDYYEQYLRYTAEKYLEGNASNS